MARYIGYAVGAAGLFLVTFLFGSFLFRLFGWDAGFTPKNVLLMSLMGWLVLGAAATGIRRLVWRTALFAVRPLRRR